MSSIPYREVSILQPDELRVLALGGRMEAVTVSPVLPLGTPPVPPAPPITPGSIGSTFDTDASGWTNSPGWVDLGGDLGGAMQIALSASWFGGDSATHRTVAELDYQEGGVITVELAFRILDTGVGGSRSRSMRLTNGGIDLFRADDLGYFVKDAGSNNVNFYGYNVVGDFNMAKVDIDTANRRVRDYNTVDGVVWVPNPWYDAPEYHTWGEIADLYLFMYSFMTAGSGGGHSSTITIDRFMASIAGA